MFSRDATDKLFRLTMWYFLFIRWRHYENLQVGYGPGHS